MGRHEIWTMGIAAPKLLAGSAVRAEAAGWDGMVVVDSQNLSGDPFVGLALAAHATEPRCGSAPASPTRPPAIRPPPRPPSPACTSPPAGGPCSASAAATRPSPTSVRPPCRPRLLEHYVHHRARVPAWRDRSRSPTCTATCRVACARSTSLGLAEHPDASSMHWLPRDLEPVPVEVVATGPRASRSPGASRRSGDAGGRCRSRARRVGDRTRSGRSRDAGLDPAGVAIGAFVNVVSHPDIDIARSLIAGGLATFARFSAMDGRVRTPVDDDAAAVLTEVHDAYDMTPPHRGRLAAGRAADRGVRRPLRHRRSSRRTACRDCSSSAIWASIASSSSGRRRDADRERRPRGVGAVRRRGDARRPSRGVRRTLSSVSP